MSEISITTSAVPDSGPVSSAVSAPPVTATPPSDTGAVTAETPETAAPRDFAEALRRRDAEAHPPETPTTPAPATAAPVVPAESAPAPHGPIPLERHQAILENARAKTREEITGALEQQYGGHIQLGEAFRQNPVETAIGILQQLQANPVYAPQLTTAAARMLAARRGQGSAADPQPEADLSGTDAEGRQVRFYSAEQQAKREAWLTQRLLSQFKQELAPIQQAYQQTREEREHAERQAVVLESVKGKLASWREQPGFREHEADLKPVQAEMVAQGMDPWTALGLAYAKVVLPKLQAQTHTKLVADAARKAAGTTENPATVTPAPPRRSRSFTEALERAAGGAA